MELKLKIPSLKTVVLLLVMTLLGAVAILTLLTVNEVRKELVSEEVIYDIQPIPGTRYACLSAYKKFGLDLACFELEEIVSTPGENSQ